MQRKTTILLRRALGLAFGFLSACVAGAAEPVDTNYVKWVNPYIGTGGHGHTHPAAVVPHGMIQPGPDTRIHGWDACSGYHFEDDSINGFSHTRLSGTGCADFGDFLLMPYVGEPDVRYVGEKESHQRCAYASPFSHRKEKAEPGYYAVFLDRYGIYAELTATQRAAFHRYTFPPAPRAGILLDLDYTIQEQLNRTMEVEVVDAQTVRARKRSAWWAYNQDLYFYARFSKPFTHRLVRDTVRAGGKLHPRCKLLLAFATQGGESVSVKTAVSAVDYEGARRNLDAELPAWNFDEVRRAARNAWNSALGRIDVRTGDVDSRTVFYTALYHALLSPSLFSDVDGRYRGMDQQIHQGDAADPQYTIFSLWDTFRALHPLLTLIEPERNAAYIRSLVQKGREGGLVPKWDCAASYTGCMIGYHFASLAADAAAKGCRGFDVRAAYEACLRLASYDTTGIAPAVPRWLYPGIMPRARHYKETMSYIPCDKENESVAKALEYAYDDWCIAQLAERLGDAENAAKYRTLARAYTHYFDPSVGYMRGKDSRGNWRTPFNPRRSEHRTDDYCEGNAYQWSWFVPHDVDGLMALYGGRDAFADKLDTLFAASSELEGNVVSADISGLIGQYAHGNEPSHHIIHLYNYANRPWRTQELADSVLYGLYANAPDGLTGNEDCGQMSAWYLLNAMGFYQVCPGKPVYSVGRPIFDCVTLRLPGAAKPLVIRTKNNGRANRYVRSVTLNGKRLKTPFFTHEQIAAGGTLVFTMGNRPSTWGSGGE